jgi:signal peptidase I
VRVLVALLLLLAARTWVAEPVRIPTSSMAATLLPGEHVLVDKVSAHVRAWRHGDVVMFRAPGTGELTVKRLVGLPGDKVAIRDGVLVVNGARVTEPYVASGAIDSVFYGPTRVPPGEVFVLGDNRRNSLDSRDYGPVPVDALEGRVMMVLWPPARMGTVR